MQPWTDTRRLLRMAVVLLISFGVCSYYLWLVRVGNGNFHWHGDQDGYYDLQGRAFASGQLHLPIDPPSEMLQLRDPWDPVQNHRYRLHDAVLFNGRYYLYHGVGPAVVLFTPWRLITGSDMPQHFGLFLLIFGAYLFNVGTLLRLLTSAHATPNPVLLAIMLIALAAGHSVVFLTGRVAVYEIAIAGGYCFLAGAFFFLAQASAKNWSKTMLALSGLFFGLAIAGRPHFGLAVCVTGIVFGVAVLRTTRSKRLVGTELVTEPLSSALPRRTGVMCFVAAFLVIASAIAWHNWARFGKPFEFGHKYQLTYAVSHRQVRLSTHNAVVGAYFTLLCPPDVSAVFPWFRLKLQNPYGHDNYDWPPGYFIEPCGGMLFFAPLALFSFAVPRRLPPGVRTIVLSVVFTAIAIYGLLTSTNLMSQRFQVDFLPWLLIVALFNAGVYLARARLLSSIFGICMLTLVIAWGFVANFALGITGPYDEMLNLRPVSYLRIARWFTYDPNYLPLLNPEVAVDLRAQFGSYGPGLSEPLVMMGHFAHRYFLVVEHEKDKLRLVGQSAAHGRRSYEIAHPRDRAVTISLRYNPLAGVMTLSLDGEPVIWHEIRTLVTARSQLSIGENKSEPFFSYPTFTGKLEILRAEVRPSAHGL
jgi:hypothetical protein